MITLEQAVVRSRNLIEAHLADNLRRLETRLLLDGEDPDDVDAILRHFTEANEEAVVAHLGTLRAELPTWLCEANAQPAVRGRMRGDGEVENHGRHGTPMDLRAHTVRFRRFSNS